MRLTRTLLFLQAFQPALAQELSLLTVSGATISTTPTAPTAKPVGRWHLIETRGRTIHTPAEIRVGSIEEADARKLLNHVAADVHSVHTVKPEVTVFE